MTKFVFFLGVIGIIVSQNFNFYSVINRGPQLAPPTAIKHVTFGYNESLADALWLRLIQDFDYCDKGKLACTKSWVYQMLNVITDLVPHLRMAYAMGPLFLDVMVGDVEGSTAIYEKGLKEFPHDWSIAFRAAYHFIFEDPHPEKAASLLRQAGENGGPQWTFQLAQKLSTPEGRKVLLDSMVEMLKREGHSQEVIDRIQRRFQP